MKITQKKRSVLLIAVLLLSAIVLLAISEYSSQGEMDEQREDLLLEARLCELIETLDGVSKAYVMVTLDSVSRDTQIASVKGVSVVCRGKSSEGLKVKITMLVSTAVGISSDKIFVSFT